MTMQVEYGRHISWQVFFLGSKTTTLLYTDYNFLCEQKEHVMIPHNSNKTSWVIFGPHIILQVYMKSHEGRDNLSHWVLV